MTTPGARIQSVIASISKADTSDSEREEDESFPPLRSLRGLRSRKRPVRRRAATPITSAQKKREPAKKEPPDNQNHTPNQQTEKEETYKESVDIELGDGTRNDAQDESSNAAKTFEKGCTGLLILSYQLRHVETVRHPTTNYLTTTHAPTSPHKHSTQHHGNHKKTTEDHQPARPPPRGERG
eukprot:TRINITY_DN61773_c0_g1_i1.p1 TRINITY_DN61773_c0_g1~~TRINITY_DN61773_c0_g1_i1.p1  ORF type:complete len:182 (-),score=16.56 TRINITY_DN61773_c0_g1_i1:10-555(-)